MNRVLVVLAAVVTLFAFGAVAGTASAHGNHNNEPKCYETIQVEKQVKDYYDFHKHQWVYKTIIVEERVEVPCETPCEEGQSGQSVETTGCQDPCEAPQVGDYEPNCEDPTCENGGITDIDICDPPVTACVDGHIVEGRESDELKATNDCGSVRLCLNGVDGVTLNEHDAAELDGATVGNCPPPPENPPTVVEEVPPPPVEITEVEAAVEEAAALPSAGYGSTSNGFAWSALAAVGLLGIAGGTALVARRKS